MQVAPRFVGRLGVADAVTVGNAALGFLAAAVAPFDPGLAARLVLLAGIADGLDGVLARKFGGTPAGPYLDSLADVASFAIAPAVLVAAIALEGAPAASLETALALGVPALFVAMAVVRLGLYTAYDTADTHTVGVPSTLAATILAAATLTGMAGGTFLLAITAVFCYLMVSQVRYPDLEAPDAVVMGVVHALAAIAPDFQGGMFPVALVTLGLAYLVLGPWLYWRDGAGILRLEGKRS